MRIRKRKRIRPCRESEGVIVPSEAVVKINPVEGRDLALFMQPKRGGNGDCGNANYFRCFQNTTEGALFQCQAGI